jgi:hypothetical protein
MLIVAILSLGGCASMPDGLGWACTGEAGDPASKARSLRLLDARGEQTGGGTEWIRTRAQDLTDIAARWSIDRGLPELDRARVVIRIDPGGFAQTSGRVMLSSDAGQIPSAFGTGSIRAITVSGAQLRSLRGRDISLGVALYNRAGELMAGSGILWADIDQGLLLARQADAASLAASADYPRLCRRQQAPLAA